MAHVREESALGPARLLRGLFGSQEFVLSPLTMDDLHFQLVRAGLQFIIRALQRTVSKLNLGKHGIETVDQPSDFIAVESSGTNLIVLV